MRHLLLRVTPRFDRRWLAALIFAGLAVAAAAYVRWGTPVSQLDLLILGPDGQFHDTVELPRDWADTATTTPEAVARFRLILGVRNLGPETVRPGRLVLSVPARYRLTGAGGEPLARSMDPASPLVRHLIEPRLEPVEPGRLPVLLPAHETLWLEAIVPRYHCVELAEFIPEFVPAQPPPLQAMREIRLLYSFEGGDLERRLTGTLSVRVDTTLLAVPMPPPAPTFPMVTDPELARPAVGEVRHVGSREVQCGEPESPMELVSQVWETEAGGRLITLEYGGAVRKHLYDLNGDGVIERESWDPDGTGRFIATRRAEFAVPEFLLPIAPAVRYDMAAFEGLPPDSLNRLDPFRGAMEGPGPMPRLGLDFREPLAAPRTAPPAGPQLPGRPVEEAPGVGPAPAQPAPAQPAPEEPAPEPAPAQRPLGTPVEELPPPPDR
jgi:hypothetical protein